MPKWLIRLFTQTAEPALGLSPVQRDVLSADLQRRHPDLPGMSSDFLQSLDRLAELYRLSREEFDSLYNAPPTPQGKRG